MPPVSQQARDRFKSAAGVLLFHALAGYLLLTGLGVRIATIATDELKTFDVREPPPPPPNVPAPPDPAQARRAKPKDPEGAASPANLRDTPTEIMAPEPVVRLPVPPPIRAAPIAGQGNAEAAGAATIPGPGTGAGGIGQGLGSGTSGTGTGGGGGGRGTPARLIRGSIDPEDYPDAAYRSRTTGVVYISFLVTPDGRVRDCRITRSSGSRALDAVTCRLIERRFRYRPARDPAGNPVASTISGQHEWSIPPEPPPIDIEPTIPDDEP
jgi:protein TonB